MVQWTNDQAEAINARGSNLLLAAAAGSGKTAVLVERIIQLIIRDKVDIDRLLIVTFTNAAAGEMRERIGNALLGEIEKGNKNEAHLRRQTTLLNRASISTLHSFCIEVVRRYFHLINIDPNFRIGDSTETAILKMEVLEEIFEEAYGMGHKDFYGLVERFGGNREDIPLQELVLKLHGFIQSQPYPLKWLKEKIHEFSMDMEELKNHPWFKTLEHEIRIQLSGVLASLEEAKKLCESPGGPIGYLLAIRDDISKIEELYSSKDITNLYGLQTIKHKRLGKNPPETDQYLIDKVKDLRQQAKDIVKDIKNNILVKSPQDYLEDLNELHPYMAYLYELISSYEARYREKKLERGIVDFNDLEHYALQILEHKEAAQDCQKKFEYIFVDEYQDSNIVQETILNFIKRDNNLFMVGDVKQSIYRFRLADPTLFIEKYEAYKSSPTHLNRRINLSKNFRSRDEIIDGVNYIFKNLMSKDFGEMDYDNQAFLYRGRDFMEFKDPVVEMEIIEKDSVQEDVEDEDIQELMDMEAEATRVAQRIKGLLNNQLYDEKKGEYRKFDYRDIIVLLRTTKNWSRSFLEILEREGIPVYADVNMGYFETIEVDIFMNLLKVIDNKMQDIPLLSLMRSPIGGFTTEELIKIRLNSDGAFYDAIQQYMALEEGGLGMKLQRLMEKIDLWKEMSRYMAIDEFIWKLYTDTGFYYYVGAMPGGKQRQGNLRVLVDRARQFQASSIRGLFNFIKFIEKLKSSSGDMGTAKILGENDNVVRIMSIHKSKGLEFPAVMVAGLGKQFNLMDINAQVLFHKELGIGPKFADPEIRRYTDTLAKIAMKNKIKLETLSEEMRILYVAMTRAKDKLILLGTTKNMVKLGEKWDKPLTPFYLSKDKSFLEWLGHIIVRHKKQDELRKSLGLSIEDAELLADDSKWRVNIISKNDLSREEIAGADKKSELKKALKEFSRDVDDGMISLVNGKLGWAYSHNEATKIPSKLSVTDIKRFSGKESDTIALTIPQMVKKPKFMEKKKGFTPMEIGTIIHFVMQHLYLNNVDSEASIEKQIEDMVLRELLKVEEAEVVDVEKIWRFFQSAIGKRIRKAERVYREIPFNLTRKAGKVISEISSCDDSLLIQGIIDCYFKEGEEYILVDYKTDNISELSKAQIVEKYRIQIELYKEALEEITGRNVKESYLYLFSLDEEVKL